MVHTVGWKKDVNIGSSVLGIDKKDINGKENDVREDRRGNGRNYNVGVDSNIMHDVGTDFIANNDVGIDSNANNEIGMSDELNGERLKATTQG